MLNSTLLLSNIVSKIKKKTSEKIQNKPSFLFFSWKEEQRKQQRKVARKEKKQKTVDDGEIDPDLAAMMGFSGFGTSKK